MSSTKVLSRLASAISKTPVYKNSVKILKETVNTTVTDLNNPNKNHDQNNHSDKVNIDLKYTIVQHKTIDLYIELPGIDLETLQMKFNINELTIYTRKIKPYDITDRTNIIKISDNCVYGTIEYSITLPIIVTKEKDINFSYTNGILFISIHKSKNKEPIIIHYTKNI